jgi:hypothetical protein
MNGVHEVAEGPAYERRDEAAILTEALEHHTIIEGAVCGVGGEDAHGLALSRSSGSLCGACLGVLGGFLG